MEHVGPILDALADSADRDDCSVFTALQPRTRHVRRILPDSICFGVNRRSIQSLVILTIESVCKHSC